MRRYRQANPHLPDWSRSPSAKKGCSLRFLWQKGQTRNTTKCVFSPRDSCGHIRGKRHCQKGDGGGTRIPNSDQPHWAIRPCCVSYRGSCGSCCSRNRPRQRPRPALAPMTLVAESDGTTAAEKKGIRGGNRTAIRSSRIRHSGRAEVAPAAAAADRENGRQLLWRIGNLRPHPKLPKVLEG
jgi:hypothetical protein